MSVSGRGRWLLYAVLIGAMALVQWADGQDRTEAGDQTRPSAPSTAAAPATHGAGTAADSPPMSQVNLALLNARPTTPSERDLFAQVSWEQKAREEALQRNPPPKPPPPPPPAAPPLPFTYLGRMVEEDRVIVFLQHGERNLVVREGETLVGVWRVDRVTDQAIGFTYVPLGKSQTLSLSASAPGTAPSRGVATAPAQLPPKDE